MSLTTKYPSDMTRPMRPAPRHCVAERHAGAFTLVPGDWGHWLIRRCTTCHELDLVPLIEVDTRFMTCLHCLSQDVELDELSDPLSCVCGECGSRSPIDVEAMELRAKSLMSEPEEDREQVDGES